MRLLKHLPNGDLELVSFNDDEAPPYAILSHTWTEGQEVTYNELVAGTGKEKGGYAKIRFCGRQAAADGLQYFWVDTCCIDKSTSVELSTAINSMFRWYQSASKCYVYLSDVQVPDEVTDAQAFWMTWKEAFRHSRWFTRGWTLQELLAPASVEFFSKEGKRLGSRISLEREIHGITKISIGVLRGQSLNEVDIEERMSWAVTRTTTLKEDRVYCLLGIFGVFLSLIYGEGEAYATLRLREEIQKRQEGQAADSLQDLTVSSSLPFPRNDTFSGREDQLQSLELFLASNIHRRITIYGLGGCGKSALALELAYRALARNASRLVFWVPAISQQSFELAYREIGIRLCVPGIIDDNADVKQLVKKALSSDSVGEWLMIVDNADDTRVLMGSIGGDPRSARLSDYLPYSNRGKILFTTRSRKAAGDLTQNNFLELSDMSKTEAWQLLSRRISKPALLDDGKATDELLEQLAYLPLAIVQAAAFINNNDISVSGYISLFRQAGNEIELFSENFEDPNRYREMESTIAKTWHISFDQIREHDPLAAKYLAFIACVDRINIPQSLFPPEGSLLQRVKAIGTLKGYAFITERQQPLQELECEKFFDMHRLVHMTSVWWLNSHNEQVAWTARAATRLEELIPYGGHERKESWMTYLSHAVHVARLGGLLDGIARASLLDRVGRCQATLGQYSTAETTHRQVISLRKKILDSEDLLTLTSLNELGNVLEGQGKYDESESIYRQILARQEKVLGPEHPYTLTSMNNLASVLDSQGKYDESESIHRQTLARQEKVLGPEHPDTLISMGNLASVLDSQGKYDESESIYRQTLARQEKVLGPENPDTLMSINNLASVLASQGKYDESESINRQTLARQEKVLGPEHPDTLMSINNLASVLASQGKYDESESIHRQTLARREKVLGPEHPDTLMSINNLASVLASQGKYDESESIYRQTLARQEKVLGPEHPDTLISMGNLASVLDSQGKYKEAEAMNRQTLAQREKILGLEHPDTLLSVYWLAYALANRHHYHESAALYERACAGYSATLGNDHPQARGCRRHYSEMLASQEHDRPSLPHDSTI